MIVCLFSFFLIQMPAFTLWIRAGSDGVRQSGDPAAHHLFMLLIMKSEADKTLTFDVKTVNEAKPPAEFKQAGLRRAPALQSTDADDVIFQLEDEILEELDKYGPRIESEDAESATADLFRQFAFYIKDVNKDDKSLNTELLRIDSYLSTSGFAFLAGSEPSSLDCLLLPRLHSIRIAAKALKDYSIPTELTSLWSYMDRGYRLKAFTSSCPSDQEIVLHWIDRPGSAPFPASKKAKLARENPTFTLNV